LGAMQYQLLITCDRFELPEFGHCPRQPSPCLKHGHGNFHLYDDWI
jgi:hypothetical protein